MAKRPPHKPITKGEKIFNCVVEILGALCMLSIPWAIGNALNAFKEDIFIFLHNFNL